jgi:predicted Zn-dependent protease with MMP-like domain
MGPDEFRVLVAHALDSVPEPFARALNEVAVVVADEPSPAQRRESGLGPGVDLYGLFEGVPRTAWAADWATVPSKITLFRLALCEDFPEPAELKHQVRVTVLHELGHYLGIDDHRLRDLGVY